MTTDLRSTLTFNEDGTIDREQLAGYPQELIDQVTDPDFQERARQMIALDIRRQHALAQLRRDIALTREKAIIEREARRPSGISGRQRKALRRIVRKIASAEAEAKGMATK